MKRKAKSLTDRFIEMLADKESQPEVCRKVHDMVFSAPVTPESVGLKAYIYHEGIGVEADLDESFRLAEEAAFDGGDPLGYFLLGYMCDNIETPDQDGGGPRQKYDHYDAERFYEKCAGIESRWQEQAHLWLAEYFMDSARGGDPEVALDHYKAIADSNVEAACRLADYYWEWVTTVDEYTQEEADELFKWTKKAAELNPEDYSAPLGYLYADGIGCDVRPDLAVEAFTDAYAYGDKDAPDAIIDILQDFRDENPDLSDAEKADIADLIALWQKEIGKD